MNRKHTKRALCMSFVSLLLCCSMLVGSTFAWFTDTATTKVNSIQAGTLDVDLVDGNGVTLVGKPALEFIKADNTTEVLWEPGCTYKLPEVRVKNNGDLKLKYKVILTGIAGDAKLNEAIEWTIGGLTMGTEYALEPKTMSAPLTIEGHMKEDAGNEYQGLTIEGISITVIATQLGGELNGIKGEYDSKDFNYDVNADYYFVDKNGIIHISDAIGMMAFAYEVNAGDNFAGKTIVLDKDIDMTGYNWIPAGSGAAYFSGTFDGNEKTISNLTVTAREKAGLFGELRGKVMDLTVVNAKVSGNHWAGVIAAYSTDNCNAEITKCVVKDSSVTVAAEYVKDEWDNGDKAGGIMGYMANDNPGITNCIVENTTITGYRDLGGIIGYAVVPVTNNAVKNLTLNVDKAHDYNGYGNDAAKYDANPVVGEIVSGATVENNTVDGTVHVVKKEVVATAAELKTILTTAGQSQAGNTTISITNDLVLAAGETWTPVTIDGYNGAGVVTIEGNGHTIKGLTDTLLAGGFAGNSGIVIKDLTIADAKITSSNNQGYGAFINCIDSMPTITLNNCHLVGSTITDTQGARVGGLIGWTAGYNNPNDGPVDTYVNINGCSVTDCTITAAGSVGAIIGHAGNNPATYHTITNCKVENCKLTSNDDGYRVGAIVGTANVGEVTITGCTSVSNTFVQDDNGAVNTRPAGQSELYGRFVPGTTGKLTIDGTAIN